MAKQLPIISASQVDTLKQCERKWAWTYLAKMPRTSSLGADLGTRVHELLAEYLTNGTVPDRHERWTWEHDKREPKPVYYPGAIAMTMIGPWLPDPKTDRDGYEVESHFTWHDAEHGIMWQGYKDLSQTMFNLPWSYMPKDLRKHLNDDVAHALLRVTDNKTSSDPVKYGQTKESLQKDVQALLYAREGIARHGLLPVQLLWNYGARDASPKKARRVMVGLTALDAITRYEQYAVPPAKRILQLYRERPAPLDLAPTVSACELYGGCPFKDQCNLTTEEKIGAYIMARKPLLDGALDEEELDEEEEDEAPPPRRKTKAAKPAAKRRAMLDDDDDEDEDEDEDDAPPPKPKRRAAKTTAKKTPAKRRASVVDDDDDDEDEDEPPKPKRRAAAQPKPNKKDKVNPPEAFDSDDEAMIEAIADRVVAKLAAKLS